jgi:hypothetical protein
MKLPSAPASSADLAPGGPPIRTIEESKSGYRRSMTATLISALTHVFVLVLLALWMLPSVVGPQVFLVQASFARSDPMALETMDLATIEPSVTEEPLEAPVDVAESIPVITVDFSPTDPARSPVDQAVLSVERVDSVAAAKQMSSSESIEDAVDSVTGALEAKWEKGDLLVVWLLDASASLVDDRQRVAARLTPFYQRIAARHGDIEHTLNSAVVSYGARMKERVPPTDFGNRIVSSIEELPVDRSGNERVFDAVARCARHYRKGWPDGQLVIVVWTDESGDDDAYLEDTIAICRQNRVSVSAVGPSSVLGADTGLHSYLDPRSQSLYQLPVKRGPETALPERIELGYWYITPMGGGRRGFRGRLPAWVGGQDLEGILCGFSPYALTRLAMQTGGAYTIFDRPEDRSPFDAATMAPYAPSYESRDTYRALVRSSPLRRAVSNAVGELAGKKVDAPPTMLFVKQTGERVFDFMRYYYPPREFQAKLQASRSRLTRQASRDAELIERALGHLSAKDSPEIELDNLLATESSPRWRAWYDLTRGRLLACSVRLEEYRLAVAAIAKPGGIAPTTNHVLLVASPTKRSTGVFVERAAQAERLLRRCVREHSGTPWEVLAQRELDFALGIAASERSIPMVNGTAPVQPNLPRF